MPTLLNFQTEQGKVAIELIKNNNFVDFWLEHFLKLTNQYKLKPNKATWPYYTHDYDNESDALIEKIFSCINEINTTSYLCPLPENFNKKQFYSLDINTQRILNKLHRYCVAATEFRDRWIKDSAPQFEFVQWEVEHFTHILNLLNQTIHGLEIFVITKHKKKFKNVLNFVEINFTASKFEDVLVYADGVDLSIPDDLQTNLRLTGYDVWIKKDILGKDFITAFADHDNPREFDIGPPPMISGGLHIDVNSKRDKLFHSKEFINWLGTVPNNYHGSYPLGNIIAGKENIVDVKNVEFISIES